MLMVVPQPKPVLTPRGQQSLQPRRPCRLAARQAGTVATSAAPSGMPYVWCAQLSLSMQGKTMDVGAKAGFYTEKSPKMLLQEWCIQKKRPTPRYKITAGDGEEQITKAKVSSVLQTLLGLACHSASRTAVYAYVELLACG